MKYSIVPEIINSKKISFFNEKDVEISICKKSIFKYILPFEKPYIIIDSFAKKTSMPEEVISIDIEELKKIGFVITTTKAGRNRWFSRQGVIYRIEPSSNISPGAKKRASLPEGHSIKKDVTNNLVRIIGPNAGYPRRGDGGPWIPIVKK